MAISIALYKYLLKRAKYYELSIQMRLTYPTIAQSLTTCSYPCYTVAMIININNNKITINGIELATCMVTPAHPNVTFELLTVIKFNYQS